MAKEAVVEDTRQEIVKDTNESEKKHEKGGVEEEEEEDSIYVPKLPNTLVVVNTGRRSIGLNFYMKRARKILRCNETLIVTGVDRAISMACTLVELLKRQKIGNVTKIATNINISPNFRRFGGNLGWGQPVPTIVFHVERGEHGTYVIDAQQKRLIDLFETKDTGNTGKLSKKLVQELNIGKCFLADKEQEEQANHYIKKLDGLDLPQFIHYCSLLIHPLLKDVVFREKMATYEKPNDSNTPATEQ